MAGGGVAALGVKTERAAQYEGRMTLAVAMTSLVAAVGGAVFGYDIGISEDYGATPPVTGTPGRRAMAIGFIVMLLSVSVGVHFGAGGFGLLLCFVGILVGSSLVAAGVRMADGPAPVFRVVFDGARSVAAFVRRNAATVGLVLASCAVTLVSGEADPVLWFATFALLLLGISLIIIGARGE